VSKSKALLDLAILLAATGATWSLRFRGVEYIGVLTMAVGIIVVLALLRWRRQTVSDIGLRVVFRGAQLRARTLEVMALTALSLAISGLVVGAILGAPQQSAAVEQLPQNVWLFLLDITVLTWIFIAFGEELVFRGMILQRLETVVGLQGQRGIAAASVAQGMIFGAGHASQGATGMLMTAVIGTALGVYFLTRGQRTLIPLIISHGVIDSSVLGISWLSKTL